MSTPGQPLPIEETFDSGAFVAARNAAQANGTSVAKVAPVVEPKKEPEPPKEQPKEVKAEPAKPAESEDDDNKPEPGAQLSRSQRREMNRLREAAAEERGKRMAMEAMIAELRGTKPPAAKSDDAEPKRESFASDAEYAAAIARYTVKQENKTAAVQSEAINTLRSQVETSNEAYNEHQKLIPDWDELQKKANDLEIKGDENILTMLATSDFRAFVVEYFVNHEDAWDKLHSLKDNVIAQRAYFARIEGKVETVYDERVKAAQASKKETSKEDRNDPADGEKPGRSEKSSEQKTRLPKPSSEVSAKGGTAPPAEPEPGSAAWMARRNAAKQTSIY